MTIVLQPPRAQWHDNLLLKISKWPKFMSLFLSITILGGLECALNVWRRRKQPDIAIQSQKRRLLWIEEAQATQGDHPRVAIVTGGNAGLGLETAKALVEAGYRTIIACRSVKKGQEAVAQIEAETGIKNMAVVMPLDLSSFESIKAFALDFKIQGHGLDVLINNAGIMDVPFTLTKDGFESQFGVNHLGHYLLTMELLPVLNRSSQGRIIVLSSNAMFPSHGIPYDHLRSKKSYSRLGYYAHSKLANLLFIKGLKRRLDQAGSRITVNAVHPGACRTNLFESGHPLMRALTAPFRPMFRSAEEGALTSIYLALAPELDTVSGEYFSDQIPRQVHQAALSEDAQEQLWVKSVEYTGVDFKL
ncbi:hypothetical protein BGZ67_010507 [Mortierella alpina]|nr:hypothetical protein BGZ67_010507 [Mortierella alpina]